MYMEHFKIYPSLNKVTQWFLLYFNWLVFVSFEIGHITVVLSYIKSMPICFVVDGPIKIDWFKFENIGLAKVWNVKSWSTPLERW